MNHRERYLAVLEGRPPDRVPFAPRLLLWYNARMATDTMPPAYKGLTLRELERKLNLGTPARDGKVFTTRTEGVETVVRKEGGDRASASIHIVEQHTPVGSIRSVTHYSDDLNALDMGGRVEEWLLKGPDDYKVWEWIWEHTYWDPAYEDYEVYDAEIGEDHVDPGKARKREDRRLDARVSRLRGVVEPELSKQVVEGAPQHDLRGELGPGHAGGLADKGNRAGCPGDRPRRPETPYRDRRHVELRGAGQQLQSARRLPDGGNAAGAAGQDRARPVRELVPEQAWGGRVPLRSCPGGLEAGGQGALLPGTRGPRSTGDRRGSGR